MATPLIKPLQVQGGTFYTFSSAASDISKTFTDDDARFVFSKFVCLDIPDVETPTNNQNNVVWEAAGMEAAGHVSDLSTDQNVNFAMSLQNYALNIEDLVLNSEYGATNLYDDSEFATTSERIFWKWLIELGAMRFQTSAFPTEATVNSRFKEETQTNIGSQRYDSVVKYIGDLDIINTVSRGGHTYTELYINIPTGHGNTPLVLFKTFPDDNYKENMTLTSTQEDIHDRIGTTHPAGLPINAYYDDDSANSYAVGATFGLVTNTSVTVNSKPVLKSDMAGVVLDFDPQNYTPIASNPNLNSISELNASDAAGDFEFNAILLYYDVYSASDPSKSATNIYGILVLDDYKNSAGGIGELKSFAKFKPNPVTKLNGNSYGLKLNVKFDTSTDNVGITTVINDYNTFSMDIFVDASTRLQETTDMFLTQKLDTISLMSRLDNLEKLIYTQDNIKTLTSEIAALESKINNASIALEDNTSILDLIANNSDKINQIIGGQLPLTLTIDSNVLDFGDGISIDRSVPNKAKIINRNQTYSSFPEISTSTGFLSYDNDNGVFDTTDINYAERNNIITLGKFSNYFKNTSATVTLNTDLVINISDLSTSWSQGQTLRISFESDINLNGNRIVLFTDAANKFNLGKYGKTIGVIDNTNIISTKPVFDVICANDIKYLFHIDVIK